MASVFLSHNSKDKPFVRELYRRLKRDGVACFFDEESIAWGENFVLSLEAAIDQCETLVLVLSPDFVTSQWVQLERTSSMADDPAGLKRKLRPLLLRDCAIPRFLKPINYIDISTTARFEEWYPKICQALGGTVRPDSDDAADRSRLPPIVDLPAHSVMPFRALGERFIARVGDFWALHDQLTAGQTAIVQGVGVVAGTGGLGKTQLAIEYAHRFAARYPGGVFWIEADQGLARLITVISGGLGLDIDGTLPLNDQLSAVWRRQNQPLASLVILDNFPETDALQPWLPPSGPIHVLVTTRRRDLTRYPQVTLQFLSPAEGAQLLNSGRRTHGSEAEALSAEVGGLPLALELLRDVLDNRPDLTTADVLTELAAAESVNLLDEFAAEYRDELPSGHAKSVVKTFELSWNLIGDLARSVLGVMAWCAPTSVPCELLREVLGLEPAPALRDPLTKAIADLRRLSLIDTDAAQRPYAHRLVLGFVRWHSTDKELRQRVYEGLRNALEAAAPLTDAATLLRLEALVPHAEAMLNSGLLDDDLTVAVCNRLGEYHKAQGRYSLARDLLQQALASNEQSYASGHPHIAKSQSNLAMVLKDLGELTEARDLLRQALAAAEQCRVPGHPHIAAYQCNLAMVLRDLGELTEAHDLLRQALASDEQRYAPGHPDIGINQCNLAMVLKDLGELTEARDLLRQALASNEQCYAPGHPSIATVQSNLALVLKDLGALAEARDLLRQALTSDEQRYAPGHPSIATRQTNLALVLKDLGELTEARDLLRQALASNEQCYASGHPHIGISQCNLAMVLKDLGELTEARDLLRQALASNEQCYAPGHPHTATFQSNLAMVLKDLGELTEARDLLRQALASDEQRYVPGHPSIARSQSNLASVLHDLGALAEARNLLRQALASNEQCYAPGHPSIATVQSNLALVLKDLGERAEARDLLRQALTSDEQRYAPGHPSIATRQTNLALVLKDLGELAEARDLLRQALASDEQRYAPGHPDIGISQCNLATVLHDLGALAEARNLLRQALASNEQCYAPGHPSIATVQSNLAMVLKGLGERAEARDLLRQAYSTFLARFGPNHPSTRIVRSNLESLGGGN